MKLIEINKFCSFIDEAIDIHGLHNRYKGMEGIDQAPVERAVKDYRSTLQGRKKGLLNPFGLDDLDKFKDNPEAFVKMVGHAVDFFKEKKEQEALYKKVYEDDKCIVTMPKGPKGAAAAGSLYKDEQGLVHCPWCVCIKYPENKKWWKQYKAAALFFIYPKGADGNPTDACCVLMTARNGVDTIEGHFSFSQVESTKNEGLSGLPNSQRKVLEMFYDKTGLSDARLVEITAPVLKPMEGKLRLAAAPEEIFAAVKDGDAQTVKKCLAIGVDADIDDEYGHSLLYLAVHKGHSEVCELLIAAGADVEAKDYDGFTPLYWAAKKGFPEICKLLIAAGADVDAKSKYGYTPLFWAVENAHSEVCKLLIDAGADVDIKDDYSLTLLHRAAQNGFSEICELLIAAGADVGAKHKLGYTPLHWAAYNGHPEICKLLIAAGADVDAKANDGSTPLCLAA